MKKDEKGRRVKTRRFILNQNRTKFTKKKLRVGFDELHYQHLLETNKQTNKQTLHLFCPLVEVLFISYHTSASEIRKYSASASHIQ